MEKKFQAHLAQHLSTFLVGFTGVLGKIIYQNPILIVFFSHFICSHRAVSSFFETQKKNLS